MVVYGSATEQKSGVVVVEQEPDVPESGSAFEMLPPVIQEPFTFTMHFPEEFFVEMYSSFGIVARPTVS